MPGPANPWSSKPDVVFDTWCPYPDCGFNGTDDMVDDHRVHAHKDESQQGSNLHHRPRD
jgi:hypothetical protein